MQRQPTLLNSCAKAATAHEARFRIDHPEPRLRNSRVIALDELAAGIVRRLALRQWRGGHFLVFEAPVRVGVANGPAADATLRAVDGSVRSLNDELDGADVAVVIATAEAGAEAASIIGDACAVRRIMSAGLVVTGAAEIDDAVSALRPNAMVLLILDDENDIPPILTALRV
jgi:hypothetical protein